MLYQGRLDGENIYLRTIELSDCTSEYVAWMNDKETNRYMETRWEKHDLDKIKTFVSQMRESDCNWQFAIVEKSSGKHIGNIKLGPVNNRYSYAEMSLFIGDKACRGKGYATEAIKLICEFGFRTLHLHRIQAGVIFGNNGSAKVLYKCGFLQEGRLRDRFTIDGEYADHLLFGRLADLAQ